MDFLVIAQSIIAGIISGVILDVWRAGRGKGSNKNKSNSFRLNFDFSFWVDLKIAFWMIVSLVFLGCPWFYVFEETGQINIESALFISIVGFISLVIGGFVNSQKNPFKTFALIFLTTSLIPVLIIGQSDGYGSNVYILVILAGMVIICGWVLRFVLSKALRKKRKLTISSETYNTVIEQANDSGLSIDQLIMSRIHTGDVTSHDPGKGERSPK